jgi:predicted house-cleaning noncanonical NTP pyrophosphatase (MazG superfamily)
MDNYATHSLKHVGRGEAFGLSTLNLRNIIIIILLPPNVVQPLHQAISDPFKILYKKKLLEWVLYEFHSSKTHHDLRKIMLNVRQSYHAMLSSVERVESLNYMKHLEDVHDFTCRSKCRCCHG